MPLCQFCRHLNPVGADRCKKCGAWISQDPEPAAEATPQGGPVQPASVSERPAEVTPLPAMDAKLLELLARGKKLEAIKLYHERTGASLLDSREFIESLTTTALPSGKDLDERILELLRRGRKIEAIKLHREATSGGLKDSKDYVEALGRRHGVQSPAVSCGTGVLLFVATTAAAWYWLA